MKKTSLSSIPRSAVSRALAWCLCASQVLVAIPVSAAPAPPPPAQPAQEKKAETPLVKVNRTPPKVKPAPAKPVFSAQPSDREIFRARVFDEPLVPMGKPSAPAENTALAEAITAYLESGNTEAITPFVAFLDAHPMSAWQPSLLTNLGIVYRRTGYYSRALVAWEQAWSQAKGETEPKAKAIADRALGELAELSARLGRFERLNELFAEIEGRELRGQVTERLAGARDGYWLMLNKPTEAFRCGPMALDRILASMRGLDYRRDSKVTQSQSTQRGTSLVQMRSLAHELGLEMQAAHRKPGADVVIPAMVHWKAGHYAALVRADGGRYLVQDPTFGDEIWVTKQALDDEASGYFLVPQGTLPKGWDVVSDAEAGDIWGKGNTGTNNPEQTTPCAEKVKDGDGPPGMFPPDMFFEGPGACPAEPAEDPDESCGMPTYDVYSLLVSLNVEDTPLFYSPPVGPVVHFRVVYNQREAYQPQIPTFSNLGPKWTTNWLSYIEDDPSNLTQSVFLMVAGGGRETYSGYDSLTQSYAPHYQSRAVITRTGTSPIRYERRWPGGVVEVFEQADGASSFPRRVFMTEWRDPQGNALSFTYDQNLRLVAVTDALEQVTTLEYELPGDDLKITTVTDPFGRQAILGYDASGRLTTITDQIGMTSSVAYGAGDVVASLTTPYGTTRFEKGESGTRRWLEIQDQAGELERVEFRHTAPGVPFDDPIGGPAGMSVANSYINYRNTYYWNRRAMSLHRGDYTKARITHWLHELDLNVASGVPESRKRPLENRVWYSYPGQTHPAFVGTQSSPSVIGRVLDDGTTQLWQYTYNAAGRRTMATDPLGREVVFVYGTSNTPDANPATGTGIDLLQVKQKNAGSPGGYDLLWSASYNSQHLPLFATDASGQTTTITYNPRGQTLTVTNAKNETANFTYDANGYLQSATGPVSGSTVGLTWDSYGRVRTVTDPDSYTLTYDYDALNRVTKVTFPDATFAQTNYEKLHVSSQRDRLGRHTHFLYDERRRPVAVQDPAGRTTNFVWCGCGSLQRLIDANGHATDWEYDLQGRVVKETREDETFSSYTYENTTSRLKQATDRKGQQANYQYLLDDRLSQISYANATISTPSVSFSYDSVFGRVGTMVDGIGTTSYAYNPIAQPPVLGSGRLASVDGPLSNDVIAYSYDELGRVTSRSIDGVAQSQVFDSLGRVTSQTNALGPFTYGYQGVTGRLASVLYPNGQSTAFDYETNAGDHRLKQIQNLLSGSVNLSKFDYTTDVVGNITTWQRQLGAGAATKYEFGYDKADQLVSAVLKTTGPTPAVLKRYGYAFDKAGNRTAEQIDDAVTGASYDAMNRLTSQQPGGALTIRGSVNETASVTVNGAPATVTAAGAFDTQVPVSSGTSNVEIKATDPSGNLRTSTYEVSQSGASKTFTYDANGSLTSDGTRTFAWDAENRLVSVTQGTLASEFTYDGLGRRVRIVEKDNGVTTSDKRFLWCGLGICEERDSTGATVAKRYFGQGVYETAGGGASFFYSRDHLGSVREVTDSVGAVRARYDYDPWGRRTKLSGDKDADFGFTGHYEHAPTGLTLAPYRAYDAGLARWISEDPIGLLSGEVDLYAYVRARPATRLDPLGLADDSVSATVRQAMARQNADEIEAVIETAGDVIRPGLKEAAKELVRDLRSPAKDMISRRCKGSVNQQFPDELRNKTVQQIIEAAKDGDKAAQTAKKLLFDQRFRK